MSVAREMDAKLTRFGKLVFSGDVERKRNSVYYKMLCDCGVEKYIARASLHNGTTKSCGCLRMAATSKRSVRNLEGQSFGRLTVIRQAGREHNRVKWLCLCSCGKETVVSGYKLGKDTNSCGCLKKEKHIESRSIDFSGKTFGWLTAVKIVRKSRLGNVWELNCACGNVVELVSTKIPIAKSCGCKTAALTSSANTTHGKSGTYPYWLRSLAKKRAMDKDLPFDISIEYVEELVNKITVCPLLGIPIKSHVGGLQPNSATLDRIIPERGYIEGNVILISHKANSMKSNATPQELMLLAENLMKLVSALP